MRKANMIKFLPNIVPGMVEFIEQQALVIEAQSISLNPDDVIIEFGSFFGLSTKCLSHGLIHNSTSTNANSVIAFDCFECSLTGEFSSHVRDYAKQNNLTVFLDEKDNKLNFKKIFDNSLKEEIKNDVVQVRDTYLTESYFENKEKKIALMHIDSPKFLEEFLIIFERFFPSLRRDSTIIFQDFYYHWSATLIAACGYMMKHGIIKPRYSVATSLIADIGRTITEHDLSQLMLMVNDENMTLDHIDYAIEYMKNVPVDRRYYFETKLEMAKFQYLMKHKGRLTGYSHLLNLLSQRQYIKRHIYNTLREFRRLNYNLRNAYKADYQKTDV